MTHPVTFERAVQCLVAAGGNEYDSRRLLRALTSGGFGLAEDASDELVCRWVNVASRAVPPEADTIIRTITKTTNGYSSSSTHWLEGLQAPLCAR